jgi:hypothetical protein
MDYALHAGCGSPGGVMIRAHPGGRRRSLARALNRFMD